MRIPEWARIMSGFGIVALVTIGIMSLIGPGMQIFGQNYLAFNKAHPQTCDYLAYCVDSNSTVTLVKDYAIECDTWWGLGSRATCPRERINLLVQGVANFTETINCHFYSIGDMVRVTEKFQYYALTNRTETSWTMRDNPC